MNSRLRPRRFATIVTGACSFIALIATDISAQDHADDHDHASPIGAVHLPVSCEAAMQDDFDHAVGLLHHMMYAQARVAFEQIAEKDAECAMAHWGIAMTLFHPLWPDRPGPEAIERARVEVERAQELAVETEAERLLIAAAAAFWGGPSDTSWWTRIERWADAMEKAHESRPDDLEIAAFYALSRLADAQTAENRAEEHAAAARLLLTLHEQEPQHPGAIHYTIHANDYQGRADESLEVVRSYDDVAPSVPHALHMPTHVYVRLGLWPEVIEWNRASAEAALAAPVDGATSGHYTHAMDYLLYAHLQRGEFDPATRILEEALDKEPYEEIFANAFHLAAMPARDAVERRDWKAAKKVEPRSFDSFDWDRYPWPESMSWFARGLGAAFSDDLDGAREAARRMGELESIASDRGETAFAAYIATDMRILEARIAHAEGDAGRALELMQESIAIERSTQKHPITPGAILPPNEALGDLLLELGRGEAALDAYRASLEIWPERLNSLFGAMRAAQAIGDERAASEFEERIRENAPDVNLEMRASLSLETPVTAR